MRILHVAHQYPPDSVGGVELYTRTVARRQAAEGHQAAVFVPSPGGGRFSAPDVEDGVRVYRRPAGRRSRTRVFLDTFADRAGFERDFRRTLAAEMPDLVHIQHLMGLPAGLVSVLVEAAIPYVVTLHDYWYGCANAQLLTNYDETLCEGPDAAYRNCARCALARAGRRDSARLEPLVAPLLARRNARLREAPARAGAVIAPTYFLRDVYGRMGFPVERIEVLPHGIELPTTHALQRPPRSPADTILHLGYLGNLARQKGVHVLIDALNRLPAHAVTLTVYGDMETFPDYAASLRRRAQHPGIRFAGPLSRAGLWTALAGLDALVVPTLWYEASSLTTLEAFAAEVPVVGSRIGAVAELIRDGVDGILFPPGDVAALSDALLGLIEDPDRLAALRAGVRPPPSIQAHVQALIELYERQLIAPGE